MKECRLRVGMRCLKCGNLIPIKQWGVKAGLAIPLEFEEYHPKDSIMYVDYYPGIDYCPNAGRKIVSFATEEPEVWLEEIWSTKVYMSDE
jgi:hypothetical protein